MYGSSEEKEAQGSLCLSSSSVGSLSLFFLLSHSSTLFPTLEDIKHFLLQTLPSSLIIYLTGILKT